MKNSIKNLLGFICALLLIGSLLLFVGIDAVFDQLHEMKWSYFIPIILVYLSTWIARGERWKLILQSSSIFISRSNSIKLVMVGYMINLFTPAKMGEIGRITGLAKINNEKNLSKSLGTIIADHFFDFIMVILFLIISLFFISTEDLPYWAHLVIWLSIIIAITGTIFLIILAKKPQLSLLLSNKLPSKLQNPTNNFFQGVSNVINHPNLLIILFISFYIWLGEIIVTFMVFYALGVTIPIYIIIFSLMIANLSKIIPITPGGIGVYEGVMSAILILFNIDKDKASVGALLDHFIKNSIILIGGGISAILLSFNIFLPED